MGVGSSKLQISVSLLYRCYILNLVKIGSVVLEKKILTNDARRHDGRWTTQGDGRQPRAIGHPRDSIDLKEQITYDFSLFNKHPPIMHVVKNHNFTIFYIHYLFKIF